MATPEAAEIPDRLRRFFNILDADQSGYIEAEEVDELLKMLGYDNEHERREKVPVLVRKLDADEDGEITLEEFAAVALAEGLIEPDVDATEGMTEADRLFYERACEFFDDLDEDGSGTIDIDELVTLLTQMGLEDAYECKNAAQTLMKKIDLDGSGEIDRDEFEEALRNGVFSEFFPSEEQEGDGAAPAAAAAAEPVRFLADGELISSNGLDDDDDGYGADTSLLLPTAEPMPGSSPQLKKKRKQDQEDMSSWSDERKQAYLKRIFDIADESGDGQIGVEELYNILQDESLHRATGGPKRNITKAYVNTVMKTLDESGDGELDFEEFVKAFETIFFNKVEGASLKDAELLALYAECDDLRAKLEEAETGRDQVKAQMAKRVAELERRNDSDQEQMQDQVDELNAKLKQLESKMSQAKAEERKNRNTIERLEQELDSLRNSGRHKTKHDSIGGVFEVKDSGSHVTEQLRRENSGLKDRLRELELQSHNQDREGSSRVYDLEIQLKKEVRISQTLREENISLDRYVGELKDRLGEEHDTSNPDISLYRSTRDFSFQSNPDLEESHQLELAQLRAERDKAASDLELAIEKAKDLKARLDANELEGSGALDKVRALQDELDRLKSNSREKQLEREVRDLTEELAQNIEDLGKVQARLDAEEKLREKRELLLNQRIQDDALAGDAQRTELQLARDRLMEARDRESAYLKEIDALKAEAQLARSQSGKTMDLLNEQLTELELANKNLQAELERARTDADAQLKRQLEQQQTDIENLKQTIAELQINEHAAVTKERERQEKLFGDRLREIADEHARALADARDRSAEERSRLQSELAQAKLQLANAETKLRMAEASDATKQLQGLLDEKEANLRALQNELASVRAELQDHVDNPREVVKVQKVFERSVIKDPAEAQKLEAQIQALRGELQYEQEHYMQGLQGMQQQLRLAEDAKAQAEAQCARLDRQLRDLEADLGNKDASVDATVRRLQDTIKNLRDQMAQRDEEMGMRFHQMKDQYEAELAHERELARDSDARYKTLQARFDDQLGSVTNDYAAMKVARQAAEADIVRLRDENARLGDRIMALEREVQDAMDGPKGQALELQRVRLDFERVSRSLEDAEQQVLLLNGQLSEVPERDHQLRALRSENTALKQHNNELSVFSSGLQAKLDAIERGGAGMERELAAIRQDCLEQRKRVIELEGHCADLEGKLRQHEAESDLARANAVRAVQLKLEDEKANVAHLQRELDDSNADVENLRRELASANDEIQRLRDLLRRAERRAHELEEQNAFDRKSREQQLDSSMSVIERERETILAELRDMQNKLREKEREHHALVEKLSSSRGKEDRIDELEHMCSRYKQQLDVTETACRRQETIIEDLTKHATHLASQLQDVINKQSGDAHTQNEMTLLAVSKLREETMQAVMEQQLAHKELERLAQLAADKRETRATELSQLQVSIAQEREFQKRLAMTAARAPKPAPKASPRGTQVRVRSVASTPRSAARGGFKDYHTVTSPRHTAQRDVRSQVRVFERSTQSARAGERSFNATSTSVVSRRHVALDGWEAGRLHHVPKSSRQGTQYFPVTIWPEASGKLHGFQGPAFLGVGPSGIAFFDAKSHQAMVSWPCAHLKRYGKEGTTFSMEFGEIGDKPGPYYMAAQESDVEEMFGAVERHCSTPQQALPY